MRRTIQTGKGLAILSLTLLTLNCGTKLPAGNFLRPSDDFASFSFRPIPLQQTSQAFFDRSLNESWVWKLPAAAKGELAFSLLAEIEQLPVSLIFTVTADGKPLLRQDLEASKFRRAPKKPGYLFFREYRLAVDLPRRASLAFSLANGSPLVGTFAIGDPIIKSAPQERPINVLILSIDTLRADYVGAYRRLLGIEPERPSFSPALDRLAAESALFTNAYTTQTSTWPALSSLFLSRLPFQHGVNDNGMMLPPRAPSLASLLFSRHYLTASFRANSYFLNIDGFSTVRNFFNRDQRLVNNGVELIEASRDQRFFFWFHFIGVHAGYTPPPAVLAEIERRPFPNRFAAIDPVLRKISRGEMPDTPETIQYVRDCYAGELLRLDRWLENIFAALRRNGLWERTLIVVLADHGEDLYDHHRHFYHHPSIYRSALHIPLFIKFPGSAHRGVYASDATIMDIAPTLLEALGIPERLPGAEGRSLLPMLRGKSVRDRPIVSESSGSRILSIIDGRWHLIYNPEKFQPLTQDGDPYPIQSLELYDMTDDPGETVSRPTEHSDVSRRLTKDLLDYLKARRFSGLRRGLDERNLSEETRRELETLGYL